ncbi:MAG: hypothetical protein WD767_12800 [Alphaproteobacteria bacterium]
MRADPRITATKLAEYMTASFARKRAILQENKYPQEVVMVRWTQAERPVSQFVTKGTSDLGFLDNEIDKLNTLTPDTDFKIQNRDLCVEALQNFKLLSNQMQFTDFRRSLGPMQRGMPIHMNGVDVSVLPQVILEGVTRKGDRVVGGIKFSFPKTHPLIETAAGYLSTLIHWHCEQHLGNLGRADMRLCHAVDVPTATAYNPPATYKRRRQHLVEACNEIVQRWPNVPPPTGYIEVDK